MKKKLIEYENLVKEWDWDKNRDIDIKLIPFASHKKTWWVCEKNKSHKWAAVVSNRTRNNSGCPYCSNQKIYKKNNLKYFHPKLAKEWHPTKNLNLKPEHISRGSQKNYWWQCKKGHSWLASPNSRTRNHYSDFKKKRILGSGCPYCSNQKVCEDNNLEFLYPKIAKQWHPTKNKKIKPKDIVAKSNKKYWWICKKGHTFQCTAYEKIMRNGCYYCAGKKVCDDNSLKILYPKIADQWHPTKNKNLTPDKFTAGSTRSFWWRCSYGHKWKATIYSRTKNKTNCPYCSNRKISSTNSLKVLFPNIAKQWHPTKNGNLTTDKIVSGSNKKVWWLCQNNHEWKTSPIHRTGDRLTGCPRCSKRISSFEIRLLSELDQLFENVKPIFKIKNNEIDLYLPIQKIGIEYDGWYYHKNRIQKDKKKNKILKSNNINLIRFREIPLPKISKYDIHIKQNKLKKKDIDILIRKIMKVSNVNSKKINKYLTKKNFQYEKEYKKYLSFYPSPIPQKSLKQTHPKLCKQWDYKKNYPLKPENFYTNSSQIAWWLCEKKHSWERRIASRTLKQRPAGCPYCSGKKIGLDNNLQINFPKISGEFDKKKNGNLKPTQIHSGSHKKVWWRCKFKHLWKAEVRSRTKQGTGCPFCSIKKRKVSRLYI